MKFSAIFSVVCSAATVSSVSGFVVRQSSSFNTKYTPQFISSSSLKMALTQDELKKMVGYKAVDDYVKSGMVVGLGT